ncbi:hypothetical protein TNCV_792751 [Trichonephila clavipes]|nr:hypothetical protein TNCV_792751 [Trichonephila clavipes]
MPGRLAVKRDGRLKSSRWHGALVWKEVSSQISSSLDRGLKLRGSFLKKNPCCLMSENVALFSNSRVFGDGSAILNHGQVTRTTPKLLPSPNFPTPPMGGRLSSRQI